LVSIRRAMCRDRKKEKERERYLSNRRFAQQHQLDAAAGLRLRGGVRHGADVGCGGPRLRRRGSMAVKGGSGTETCARKSVVEGGGRLVSTANRPAR